MKCLNCRSKNLKKAFVTTEKGIMYIVEGDPDFKTQMMGKKKKTTTKLCQDCGFIMNFANE
jgi:hypothetical protein